MCQASRGGEGVSVFALVVLPAHVHGALIERSELEQCLHITRHLCAICRDFEISQGKLPNIGCVAGNPIILRKEIRLVVDVPQLTHRQMQGSGYPAWIVLVVDGHIEDAINYELVPKLWTILIQHRRNRRILRELWRAWRVEKSDPV